MSNEARFYDWGHWGITFWEGSRAPGKHRAVAQIEFPVGSTGPIDGYLGSAERQRWKDVGHDWAERGELPEGAHCPISSAWLYDEACPGARWHNNRWQSPTRCGHSWVYGEAA